MNDRIAVSIHFGPAEYEIHYLAHIPRVGDVVTHRGLGWVVAGVDLATSGTVVRCELPRSVDRRTKGVGEHHRGR